jgi:hypothetical protein
MRVNLIVAYDDVGYPIFYYPGEKAKYNDFDTAVNGKGYWVQISSKLGTLSTLDGYSIEFFSSKSGEFSDDLKTKIENSTLEEVLSISEWDNVTAVKIGEKEYSTGSLSTVSVDSIKKDLTSGVENASLYIYGISDGSAPYSLSDALIYKVNKDGRTSLIGKSDINGFLTSAELISGTKILIKKDGMTDKIYTIEGSGTLYLFLNSDDAMELPAEKKDTSSKRTVSHYIRETFKHKDNIGYYSPTTKDSLKQDLPIRKIKPVSIDGLDESSSLKTLIDSKIKDGYKSSVLVSFDFYLKVSKKLGGKAYGKFSEYYPDSISPKLVIALPDSDYYTIKDLLAKKGGELRVFRFDGSEWRETSSEKLTLSTVGEENTKIKSSFSKKYSSSTPVLEIENGGFYPYVIVIDKKVSFNYPINFHIIDKDKKGLSDSAVFIGDDLIGITNESGYLEYNITAGYSDTDFYVKAMKSDYKSSDATINLKSLKVDSKNNITLELDKIATTASVEGLVYDKNETNPVYLSKVNLYFPYALAYVKANELKDGVLGIKVGYQPNTTYKWYMKVHTDTLVSDGVSPRISKKRWIEIKEGGSSDGGNFLSYQEMKQAIIEARKDGDPDDIKSMVSGLFDIALIAEHDIDGDGSPDVVELATTSDEVKTDFETSYEDTVKIDNYAKIIGNIKFNFDVKKFAKEASKSSDISPAVKIDSKWYYGADDADDETESDPYFSNTKYVDNGSKDSESEFQISIDDNYFTYKGINETTLQAKGDYSVKYMVSLVGDLTTADEENKSVALVKTSTGYKWEIISSDVEDYQLYAKLYDMDAGITIGQKVYDSNKTTIFDGLIPYNRISKYISQNDIMGKLNMTLSQIAEEAGVSDAVKKAISDAGENDKLFIATGMNIVPMVAITGKNDESKEITLVEGEQLQQGGIDVSEYILTGKVNVNPPISAPTILKDTTDRSGKFRFPKLPMDYSKLTGKDISMLTLSAKKYAHINSPLINVPSYEKGDVKNIKLNLPSKDIVTVNVNIIDEDTNKSIEANITIDGQYKEIKSVLDSYKEYSSLESKIGSSVSFNDIIAGARTISVIKDGYYPVTLTEPVYKDNENNITIPLKKASKIDDVIEPSLGLLSYVSDEIHGVIKLEMFGFDTDDVTLKKVDGEFVSKLIVYDNGDRIEPKITMNEDGTIDVVITSPKIGENEIFAKLVNPRGESVISPINIDFNPTIGSIKGYITDFIDEDANSLIDTGYMGVVDLYDKDMNYLSSVITNSDGSYLFPSVKIGEAYLKASLIDSSFGISKKESKFIRTVVAVGAVKRVNLPLEDKKIDSSSWVPIIDFDPAITEEELSSDANDNNGTITIKGQVSKFDVDGQLVIMVNYTPYVITSDDISAEDVEKGVYNYSKDLNLSKGLNKIVARVINPNGFYDTTPILDVKYGEEEKYRIRISLKNDNNESVPYALVDISNPVAGIYSSGDTGKSGKFTSDSIPNVKGMYYIDVYSPEYKGLNIHLADLKTADLKDGKEDKIIDMNLTLHSDIITPKFVIEDIKYEQELSFEVPEGIIVKGKNTKFSITTSDDEVHSYSVIVTDSLTGDLLKEFVLDESNIFEYIFEMTGNYTIYISDKKKLLPPYVLNVNVAGLDEVLPTPPSAPVIPTPIPTK